MALMQTSTDYATRFHLIQQVLGVQNQLGASTKSMAESAEALVDYGRHLGTSFQQDLKLVVMMKDGLGISARSGAELVTIFARQLHSSAQDVADVMANIAASTGLSAEKAARFAIEIGKSLRLLGPTAGREAPGITKVIATLAGRVREMGGNEQSIIEMHRHLTSMETSGLVLRSLGRGTSLTDLTTAAGSQAALQRIAADLRRTIGNPGKTAAEMQNYLIKTKQFGELIGMQAEDLVNFLDSMDHLNDTVKKTTTVQTAWQEQTGQLGQAFGQIKEAFGALATQALLPLLQEITPLVVETAAFVKHLASLQNVISGVQIAVETFARSMYDLLVSLLGTKTGVLGAAASQLLLKLNPMSASDETLKAIKDLVKDWSKGWAKNAEDQKQQNLQVIAAKPKTAEEVAGELLARVDLAKSDTEKAALQAQFDKAFAAAKDKGATMESVSAAALGVFKSGAWAEMLQRGRTEKTPEEIKRDDLLAVALQQLELMAKQYNESRKGVTVAKEAATDMNTRHQESKDRMMLNWDEPFRYTPSHASSYKPN